MYKRQAHTELQQNMPSEQLNNVYRTSNMPPSEARVNSKSHIHSGAPASQGLCSKSGAHIVANIHNICGTSKVVKLKETPNKKL